MLHEHTLRHIRIKLCASHKGVNKKQNPKGAWALKDLGPKIKLQQALALEKIVPLEVAPNLQTKTTKIRTYFFGV